jgi:paraquat-inducible protein B
VKYKNEEVVEVRIKKREITFVVWLVPLIALIVGGWMVYKYYAKLGPKIVITFKNSGGLEPKRSYIKFRDVKVGVVERVEILKQSDGVVVTARMNKDVEPFLNETTLFWVVKPQIGAGKIEGLDALVSGSYIQMRADLGKEERRYFEGLDEPPLNPMGLPGKSFRIFAPHGRDLMPGSPIFYKDVKVGNVERVELVGDGKGVYIYAFVQEPFTKYINATTSFWRVEALRVAMRQKGVDLHMASLGKIIPGAISFETADLALKSSFDHPFYLHASSVEALGKRMGVGQREYMPFVMRFEQGCEGLEVGDGVYFRDYKVGYVHQIVAKLKKRNLDEKVVVMIDLASFRQKAGDDGMKRLGELVDKGLRARVGGYPFVGLRHIELVFDSKGGKMVKKGALYHFPTTTTPPQRWLWELKEMVHKIQNLPLEKTLRSIARLSDETRAPLKRSLQQLTLSLQKLNTLLGDDALRRLPAELGETLDELKRSLEAYKDLAQEYGRGSVFKDRLDTLLKDIDQAAKKSKEFMQKLNQKPNAIIFGE